MKAEYQYKDDTYIIKMEPKIVMPEVRLFQAILCQAMDDVEKGSPRERDSAIRWVLSDDNDLLELCLFASKVSKRDIMNKIEALILEKAQKIIPLGGQLF